MSQEVVLKEVDGTWFALVPELGVLERAPDATAAHRAATLAAERVRGAFRTAGAEDLLRPRGELIQVRVWSAKLRRSICIAVVVVLVGMGLIGLTVTNSVRRAVTSIELSLFDDDPARMEKNREKFRVLLQKYRPLIEEWQQATARP